MSETVYLLVPITGILLHLVVFQIIYKASVIVKEPDEYMWYHKKEKYKGLKDFNVRLKTYYDLRIRVLAYVYLAIVPIAALILGFIYY